MCVCVCVCVERVERESGESMKSEIGDREWRERLER